MRRFVIRMWPFFLLLLLCFPTIYPILQPGMYPNFDGDLHIVRIWQMYQALRVGQIPGRWAGSLFEGLGHPLFVVNLQFPYYVGAALYALGMSLLDSLKTQLVAAIILSAIGMYAMLKRWFGAVPSIVGAVLYTWSPYRFVDTYTRVAIGEVWIFVLLPLLFLAMSSPKKNTWSMILLGSLSWACAVLSHTSFMIVLFPFLFASSLFLWWEKRDVFYLLRFLLMIGFGTLLASFSWMPAVFERGYLQFDSLLQTAYTTQFITVSQLFLIPEVGKQTISMLQFGLVNTFILGITIWRLMRSRESHRGIWFVSCCVIISLFLITPQSKFIWDTLPLLHIVIFPWRLLILAVFFSSIACSWLIQQIVPSPRQYLLATLCITCIVCTNVIYLYPGKRSYPSDAQYMHYTGTTNSFADVFMPKGASDTLLRYKNPLIEVREGDATITDLKKESGHITFQIMSTNLETHIKIAQLYFPGWVARNDGNTIPISTVMNVSQQDQTSKAYGLLNVTIPQGKHTIDIRFQETPLRRAADILSLISGVSWVGLSVISFLYHKRFRNFIMH